MIGKMRKLTLLIYHREKDAFLESLQDLGVVHVVQNPEMSSEVLQDTQARIKACERVIAELKKVRVQTKPTLSAYQRARAEEMIRKVEDTLDRKEVLQQQITALRKDIAALTPWGDFDPEGVDRLRTIGIRARFFEATEKKFAGLDLSAVCHEVVRQEQGRVWFVVLEQAERVALEGAEETVLPRISLKQAQRQVEAKGEEITKISQTMAEISADMDLLHSYVRELTVAARYEAVRISMEDAAGGKVLGLTGWLPPDKEEKVREFLDQYAAWHAFDDPGPEDDVPIVLKNNWFAKLFEPITKIFALPHHTELDPTPFFAPFFALFVGLCMGDAAYGLILLTIGLIAAKKAPVSVRGIFLLLAVLGASVTVGGLLLNTFFGHTLFGGPGVPEKTAFIPWGAEYFAPLSPLETQKGTFYPAIPFALMVGIVQTLLAMVLRAVNRYDQGGVAGALLPVGMILMLLGGLIWDAHGDFLKVSLGTLQIGPVPVGALFRFPSLLVGKAMVIAGLVFLFFFNNPDKKVAVRLPLGLWELYGFVTGLLGDILSYLRLFALGLAGGLLGNAFNYVAFMIITTDGQVNYATPLIVFTIVILVIGHSLNILLSMIGSFVHPLRLTFVEFYKNLDFRGGGKVYSPFARS